MSQPPGGFARHLAARADPVRVDVQTALDRPTLAHLPTLLSADAAPHLEDLAQRARQVTLQRFGRAVRLFAPLYVSNACLSTCTYCGFSKGLDVVRRTLSVDQVVQEAQALVDKGFRHLLLVSGEHRLEVSQDYLLSCVEALRPLVPSLSIETQTWSDDTYARLVAAGLEGVVHYQETYDRARYAEVHLAGWKRDFDRRLSSTERAAEAGVRRIGIGALLGLSADWRADVVAVAEHALWLQRHYWRTEVTVSLPRIKPSASGFQPLVPVSDAEYVQAMAALRLVAPEVGIVLSTREPAALRDGLVRIAVTHMSAGSSTEPGGYLHPGEAQEQFAVSDERSPAEVASMLEEAGYEPVWKDAFALR
ncbi:MAG TPA: 2-iminoacetate synthase ThiH [Mycobacteriales bacterium]|nr:2-iminoacetate synthase ThiH [Mycobacteriales bacterium]